MAASGRSGCPTFEDKIVQRAVTMLLGAVYEQDFHDFSHGFREGHSPHQALQELREQCMDGHIGWIVDADVSGFFDSLDHDLLRDVHSATGQGWGDIASHREMAAGGSAGGGHPDVPRARAPRRAASSRRCWPISSCIRSWMNGTSTTSNPG